MERQALNQYLKAYDVSVNELCKLTNQSPQTLRNWYGKGMVKNKSYVILCLVAAIKWRRHYLITEAVAEEFKADETLTSYLEPNHVTVEEIMTISHQSNQTLRNWLNSPDKQMLIDVLVYAVNWYRFAYEHGYLKLNPSFPDISSALALPITDSQNKTNFTLEKFIRRSSRKDLPKWTDAIVERRNNGQISNKTRQD